MYKRQVLRDGTTWDLITLPTGAYESGDIEAFLKKQLGDSNISLRPNNNTLKCELTCALDIDFQQTVYGIGDMLGFKKKRLLEANKTHTSDATVNIIKVNSILTVSYTHLDVYKRQIVGYIKTYL